MKALKLLVKFLIVAFTRKEKEIQYKIKYIKQRDLHKN